MGSDTLRLPFDDEPDRLTLRDEAARRFAVDPRQNVVLEASAGTGKTTVLVTRYINLLKAGVDPTNILAITFTRKAAAEMRQRIVHELKRSAALSAADAARWQELGDRLGDIAISTIDAFCLSLLREFPLEAGLEPAFDIADDTLVARLKQDALQRAVEVCARLAGRDDDLRLLIAQFGEQKLERSLARLLDRRLVARGILRRYTRGAVVPFGDIERAVAGRVTAAMSALAGGLDEFLADGPQFHPAFALVTTDLRRATAPGTSDRASLRASLDGLREYFLTRTGQPRQRLSAAIRKEHFSTPEAARRHSRALKHVAPGVADALTLFAQHLNLALARGVRRAFHVAVTQYMRALEANAVLDFSGVLERALELLSRMDEFSQSRYRLEARYHHVLVDEFQDTSRAQWRLVSLLIKSWGEGVGLSHDALPPSIFVVGDRKQSIYGFRDADVTMLRRARHDIEALRPAGRPRRSISRSFRSAPALLAFANDLFASMEPGTRADRFRFTARDAFPLHEPIAHDARVGVVAAADGAGCAQGVAAELQHLLQRRVIVRDPRTKLPRAIEPGDVAILFRSREGHQEYERALSARGIPSYVYKGLGFFDADETRDLLAVVDYLARPHSDLAAAAFLRSRFVRLSDVALKRLGKKPAALLSADASSATDRALDDEDARVLQQARKAVASWLPMVDRLTPAELLEQVLAESAYAYETRGARRVQARENIKKLRALIRKIQNRGYATLVDVARYLRTLSAGDESNAVIDAQDAVNLMTVHAAKGLEFPVVFVVNLGRGTGGGRDPIRVTSDRGADCVAVGDFSSDADQQARERDCEETKRLLYVAVTRARDYLYFSSPVGDGKFSPARGSLGAVLPASFTALFNVPSSSGTATWTGPSGRVHSIDVAAESGQGGTAASDATHAVPPEEQPGTGGVVADDCFEPLALPAIERLPATTWAARTDGDSLVAAGDVVPADRPTAGEPRDQAVLVGLLVHRLFQFCTNRGTRPSTDELTSHAMALLTAEELAGMDEVPSSTIVDSAVSAIGAICAHPDVVALLATGKWAHEVPFSMLVQEEMRSTEPQRDQAAPAIVRGAIDAVVDTPGEVVVVELKTGAPRADHEVQLDLYTRAVRSLYPTRQVRGLLVYAE